jgi:hypothetical protein
MPGVGVRVGSAAATVEVGTAGVVTAVLGLVLARASVAVREVLPEARRGAVGAVDTLPEPEVLPLTVCESEGTNGGFGGIGIMRLGLKKPDALGVEELPDGAVGLEPTICVPPPL